MTGGSSARAAHVAATRLRAEEIAADQAEAVALVAQAINGLREKGYPPQFIRSLLEGFVLYDAACTGDAP